MTDTDDRQTMKDVSHTNPYTGETAGHLFQRGPVVAADGGRRDGAPAATDTAEGADGTTTDAQTATPEETAKMKDVSHTPPHDATDANRVFERGGREEGDGGDASERDE